MRKLTNFFISYQPQFFFLLMIAIVLYLLSQLPYFNLILGKVLIALLLWLAVIFIFKPSGRFSIKTGLITLCFCPLLLILKQKNLAEEAGNLVYGFFLAGAIQELIVYKKLLK